MFAIPHAGDKGRSDDCARVFVTALASGIGQEIVCTLAAQKAKVFVCEIDAKALLPPRSLPDFGRRQVNLESGAADRPRYAEGFVIRLEIIEERKR